MTVTIIKLIKKKYKKEIITAALVVTDATANITLLYMCDRSDN